MIEYLTASLSAVLWPVMLVSSGNAIIRLSSRSNMFDRHAERATQR